MALDNRLASIDRVADQSYEEKSTSLFAVLLLALSRCQQFSSGNAYLLLQTHSLIRD